MKFRSYGNLNSHSTIELGERGDPVYYSRNIGSHIWLADGQSCEVRLTYFDAQSFEWEVYRTKHTEEGPGILSDDERGMRGGESRSYDVVLLSGTSRFDERL